MNEGCSACACGIQGACDKLYLPAYTVPGAIALVVILIILIVCVTRGVIKIRLRVLVSIWIAVALIFAGLVWVQTETAGDRTAKGVEYCRDSGAPNCEY